MFVALHLPSEHNFKSESDIELERASRLYTPCLWSLITIPKGWFSTDSKKSDHWHFAKGSDQVISKMLNTTQSEVSSKMQLEKRVKQFVIIKSTWKKWTLVSQSVVPHLQFSDALIFHSTALLRAWGEKRWIYLVGVVVDASWDEDEGEVDGGDEGGEVGHPHPHLASQLALLQNISLAMLLKTSNVWRVTPNGPAAKEFPRWSNGCQFKIRTCSSRPQDSIGSSKQCQKKFATKVWDHYICCANSFKFLQGIHMRSWSISSVYRVESLRAMSSDWWVARQRWGLTADSKLSLGSNKLKVGFAAENHFPPSRRPAPHVLPLTRLRKVTSTAEQLSLYHNWTLALGEPSTLPLT